MHPTSTPDSPQRANITKKGSFMNVCISNLDFFMVSKLQKATSKVSYFYLFILQCISVRNHIQRPTGFHSEHIVMRF